MLPKLVLIRQTNEATPRVENAHQAVLDQIAALRLPQEKIRGKRIGITAGSRGIDRIPELIRAVVDYVKAQGGTPVVFAAMGSHGGGTAEGQREMLTSLEITEESVGAPIECSAEYGSLGKSPSGYDVYYNRLVDSFDGLIALNRVKPHTDFSGETESGLLKMFAIGVGGPRGCRAVHAMALTHGYSPVIQEIAQVMIGHFPVLFGVMVTENWRAQLDSVTAVLPQDFYAEEVRRLAYVKEHMVKLPVKKCDTLIVGEIGKNISGAGMDTKVIGRIMIKGQPEPEYPVIKRIIVRSLTKESHGNATGIGLADMTTQKVLDSINITATSLNCLSSSSPEQGRIPCVLQTEREAVVASLTTLGFEESEFDQAHMIYIKNTNSMEIMGVSEALYEVLRGNPHIQALRPAEEMRFSEAGELLNFQEDFWPQ